MFNIEIIHFLQGLDHPFIYGIMALVSYLGLSPVIMSLCLSIAFGLDLKKGLVMLNIVAWTAFFSFLLQSQFNFDTPLLIDPSVSLGEISQTANGFPAGSMAVQVAFWMSFLLLFKKRWILNLSVVMILLSAVSSLYLAQSFLGDLLGGIALGIIVTSLSLLFIVRSRYLKLQTHDSFSLSFFWLPWLALPFAAYLTYWQLASTLGLNMAVIFIVQRRNFPVFHVITWKRVLAALMIIIAFLATYFLNERIDLISSSVIDYMLITILNFLVVLSILSISRRLYLIKYRLGF